MRSLLPRRYCILSSIEYRNRLTGIIPVRDVFVYCNRALIKLPRKIYFAYIDKFERRIAIRLLDLTNDDATIKRSYPKNIWT